MEKFEERILNSIEKDIEDNSMMVIQMVNQEIETMRKNQLGIYQAGLNKETETYLERELSELKLFATTQASQDRLKKRRDLLEMRTQMTEEVVSEVTKRLQDFVASDAYVTYINKRLDEIEIGNGYFEVRAQDEALMKKILASRNLTNEVVVRYFAIGGFNYVDMDKKLEYSCDLYQRLQEAREYFRGHSGFTLVEDGAVHE